MKRRVMMLGAVWVISACADSLPDGPSGGKNDVAIAVGGSNVDFTFEQLEAIGRNETITIAAAGTIDPVPEGDDDETTLILELVLNRPMLDALTMPSTVNIDGTTTFPGGYVDLTWSTRVPGATESSLIRNVLFRRMHFQMDSGMGAQEVSGTLTLTLAGEHEIAGTIIADVNGSTGSGREESVSVHVRFDLPVTQLPDR